MLALRTVQRLSCMQPSAMARLSTRASSIPLINQVVENKTASPVCLVEHPYVLDGYKTPGVLQEKRDVFAVVDFSGTQYKVVNDDVIVSDNMEGYDIGQIVNLDKVLLVGSKSATLVGKPLVSGASVMAVVEEMAKDKKVMTLKFRRRKNSKNIRGFRRQLTILRVKSITLNDESTKDLGL